MCCLGIQTENTLRSPEELTIWALFKKKRWGLYFIKAPLHWIEMSLLGLGWKQLILISVATDRGIDPACSRLVG